MRTMLRDLDFSRSGIQRRWQSGYADTKRTLERRPWGDDYRSDGRGCGP
jgi:NTE family protein